MKDQSSTDHRDTDRYRVLFENSADALLIIENDQFVDCNQAAVDMLRYSGKDALLQRHPSEISPEFQPDGKRSFDKANEILATITDKRNQRFEWMHLTADGKELPVEVLLTAIPSEDGFILHNVWRDLTEKKRLEQELRHSQKMEVLGHLAGGIAHDFNNTLVPIVTYSDLLIRALDDRTQLQEWASEISRAATLAATLVKKLLTVTRKDVRQPIALNFGSAISGLVGILKKLIGEDVTVDFHNASHDLWIETDPGDVEQIVLNLASNARDALPTGGNFVLSLSSVHQGAQKWAKLEVTDDGVGMDPETLERLFVPFFTTKELGRGTGLGMSTVFELVAKAAGTIEARSAPGHGTTIEIRFPLVEPADHHAKESYVPAQAMDANPERSSVQILVVEDDAQISRLMRDVLTRHGYRVRSAINGISALELLTEEQPDLIVTDVVMSRMSGPEMVAEMQNRGISVPVIFLSGYTDDRLAAHGFDPTAVSLIRKPFTENLLVSTVQKALRLATTSAGSSPSKTHS